MESRLHKWKPILTLAWPLIIANSFWNLQLTVDRVFLGQFSTEALGAAMAVMGVFWTPMALLQQTAAYLTTFVAQYFGAKEEPMIGPAFWQSIYISLVGGILFLGLIPLAAPFFAWTGHSPAVQALETEYFVALCYSALPTAIVAATSAFFTGLGNTRIIIGINSVGLVGNVVLDYLLIFGNFGFPRMGIAGAGYATAIATWLAAFYGLWLVVRRSHEGPYKILSGWRPRWDLMKRYIKYGLPSGMQWALEGLAFTVFLILIGRMPQGDAGLAASGIVVTVMLLAVLPAMGVAQAVMVLMGQHMGERRTDAAETATWAGLQIAAVYIFTVALTFAIFPQFYLSWFANSENPALWHQVSETAAILLLFVAAFTTFDSMNFVFSFALKGAGDTRFVTLIALIIPWPIMVVPTWILKDQPNAVYWAWAAASTYVIVQAIVFWRRFVGGRWKKMSVIH